MKMNSFPLKYWQKHTNVMSSVWCLIFLRFKSLHCSGLSLPLSHQQGVLLHKYANTQWEVIKLLFMYLFRNNVNFIAWGWFQFLHSLGVLCGRIAVFLDHPSTKSFMILAGWWNSPLWSADRARLRRRGTFSCLSYEFTSCCLDLRIWNYHSCCNCMFYNY